MSGSSCLRTALRATASNGRPLISTAALRSGTTGAFLHQPPNSVQRQYATASVTPTDAPQSLDVDNWSSPLVEKKNRERLERIVKKHLDHMSDPWHVAQYVEQTLKRDRFDEALLLTQKASKDGQIVVAWNHLIDYQLRQDRIKPAIKLFNEMKKRSQLPNVQTFTIIFRGCAKSQHPKLAIAEAMKHYNILLNDSRLQPNSIHLNAVLNVCARAGDVDSMFLAADSINESTRAPTAYTYTIIFNALRHSALEGTRDLTEEEQLANLQKIIDRSRSIWTEVIDKWRRGRLVIDEELVCSMARLLLVSRNRQEKRGILDLLQQTMNIPNLAKSSDSDDYLAPDMRGIAVSGIPKTVPATTAVYAIPSRNTLALILTILASAKLTTCGIKYWNLMVRHYGIVPDGDNWLRLFGMLKVARASGHAADVLNILPEEYLGPKPFRIAMETCVRDNISPRAVPNSKRVLDSMLARLRPVPDLQALRLYLRVALVSHYAIRQKFQGGDEDAAKRKYGFQILAALEHLWEPYKQTHYHYFKASKQEEDTTTTTTTKTTASQTHENNEENNNNNNNNSLGELYNNKREVISLARHMFSAFNKVQNEKMVPDKVLRDLRPRYAKINREIQAFFHDREEREPKLRPRRGRRAFSPGDEDGNPFERGREAEDEEWEDVAEVGEEQDPEAITKRGGDFVWHTGRPVNIMTREERRRKGREEWQKRKAEEEIIATPEI